MVDESGTERRIVTWAQLIIALSTFAIVVVSALLILEHRLTVLEKDQANFTEQVRFRADVDRDVLSRLDAIQKDVNKLVTDLAVHQAKGEPNNK